MVTTTIPVEPFDLVIFGGTGDLSMRKLMPALYQRWRARQMPADARVICVGRQEIENEAFKNRIQDSFRSLKIPNSDDQEQLDEFLRVVRYLRIDVTGSDGWSDLKHMLRDDVVRAFYLSGCSVAVRRDHGQG